MWNGVSGEWQGLLATADATVEMVSPGMLQQLESVALPGKRSQSSAKAIALSANFSSKHRFRPSQSFQTPQRKTPLEE